MAVDRRHSWELKVVASEEQESAMGRGRKGRCWFFYLPPVELFIFFKLLIHDSLDKKEKEKS